MMEVILKVCFGILHEGDWGGLESLNLLRRHLRQLVAVAAASTPNRASASCFGYIDHKLHCVTRLILLLCIKLETDGCRPSSLLWNPACDSRYSHGSHLDGASDGFLEETD
jgi:hypothetical protein